MAVYIPKERLGSFVEEKRRAKSIALASRDPEVIGKFQEVKAASEVAQQNLRERYDSNAEVQRHRTLTKEEKSRDAIERLTKNIKEHNDMKAGGVTSEEAARKKAETIARRHDVDVGK